MLLPPFSLFDAFILREVLSVAIEERTVEAAAFRPEDMVEVTSLISFVGRAKELLRDAVLRRSLFAFADVLLR